jgi:hypothetical protein
LSPEFGCEGASDQKNLSRGVAHRRSYLHAAISETNPIGFGFIDENAGGAGVTNEIGTKNYEIFIGQKEYDFGLWIHFYTL